MVLQRKVNMLDIYNSGCRKAKTYMQIDMTVNSRRCRNPTVSVKARVSVNSNPNLTRAVNFRTSTTCQHKYAVIDQRS